MSNITIKVFAGQLANLAKEAPDPYVRHDLHRCLYLFRLRYSVPFEKKKEIVFRTIESGAVKKAEIEEETGFTEWQVRKTLAALEKENRIRKTRRSFYQTGRPALVYEIVQN